MGRFQAVMDNAFANFMVCWEAMRTVVNVYVTKPIGTPEFLEVPILLTIIVVIFAELFLRHRQLVDDVRGDKNKAQKGAVKEGTKGPKKAKKPLLPGAEKLTSKADIALVRDIMRKQEKEEALNNRERRMLKKLERLETETPAEMAARIAAAEEASTDASETPVDEDNNINKKKKKSAKNNERVKMKEQEAAVQEETTSTAPAEPNYIMKGSGTRQMKDVALPSAVPNLDKRARKKEEKEGWTVVKKNK